MFGKIHISDESGIGESRRRAIELAQALGFDEVSAGRVAIAAAEMATNLMRHAGGGDILLSVEAQAARGISILALDRGPGISSLSEAMRDGFSRAGTSGNGLGALQRISNRFDIHSQRGIGTAVLAQMCADSGVSIDCTIGVLNVPHPQEIVSGDGWTMRRRHAQSTILVVDGLGHGVEAAHAAHTAQDTFHNHTSDEPAALIAAIHDALRPTRGAAAAVVHLDAQQRLVRFAGVGNLGACILAGDSVRHLVSHNGTAGHSVRRIQEFSYPWPEHALLVMHSDGLTTRWNLTHYQGLRSCHPTLIAGVLYRDFSRGRDDTIVVVVRDAP